MATRAGVATLASYAYASGFSTVTSIAGFASVATQAGVATLAPYSYIAGFSTVSGVAGFATYASTAGIVTYSSNSGIASYASVAGIVTFAAVAGFATVSAIAGFSTVAAVAGFATIASQAGVSTLASYSYSAGFSTVTSIAGFASVATQAGVSTLASYAYASGFSTVSTQAGVSTSVVGGVANVTSLNVSGLSTLTSISAGGTTGTSQYVLTSTGTGLSWQALSGIGAITGVNIAPDTTNAVRFIPFVNISSGTTASEYVATSKLVFNPGEGHLGIGSTNPSVELSVVGDVFISGVLTATTIYGNVVGSVASGTANYAFLAGFSTVSAIAGFSTVSAVAGFASVSTRAGVATFATLAGSAGFATVSTFAGVSTFANISSVAGFSTYASTSGFATVATQAGVSTSVVGGVVNVNTLQVTGVSTFTAGNGPVLIGGGTSTGTTNQVLQIVGINSGVYVGGNLGIGSTVPTSKLSIVGNVLVSGVITSITGGFRGQLTGVSNYSYIAGFSTVSSVAGFATVSNIASISGFATVASIAGFSTFASTSGFATVATQAGVSTSVVGGVVNVNTLQVTGVSTFSTANGPVLIGGGTSTGTINQVLQIVGINSSVFIGGNFGIGSTIPTSKLTVQGDVLVSGVTTSTGGFRGQLTGVSNYSYLAGFSTVAGVAGFATVSNIASIAGFATVASIAGFSTVAAVAGFATVATQAGISTSVVGGVANVTSLNVSGISTLGTVNISAGIVTATSGVVTYYGDGSKLSGIAAGIATYANNAGIATNLKNGAGGSIPYQTAANTTAFLANGIIGQLLQSNGGTSAPSWANPQGLTIGYAVTAGISTYSTSSGIATYAYIAGFSTVSTFAGVATFANISSVAGFSTFASVSGFATVSRQAGVSTIASVAGFATVATQAGISTSVIGGVVNVNTLQVTGVSTFTNGPVLIGSGTLTGTASQLLQVTGGAYFSGIDSVGIGITNPSGKLHISTQNESSILLQRGSDTWNAGDYHEIVSRGTTGGNPRVFSRIRTTVIQPVGSSSASVLQFYTNNGSIDSEVARFNDSGNLGIGTTNPTQKLHVQGNVRITGGLYDSNNIVGAAGSVLVSTGAGISWGTAPASGGGGSALSISTSSSSTPQFITFVSTASTTSIGITNTKLTFIPSSGSLGIGTTNPAQNLHVLGNFLVAAGSSTAQYITQKAYEINNGTLSWEGSAGQLFSITNNLTSGSIFSVNDVSGIPSIDVNANGTVSMVAYGGNLGIGTTLPTSKLTVTGDNYTTGVTTSLGGFRGQLTGVSNYAYIAGFSSVTGVAGFSTISAVAGFATVSNQAGISSYSLFANLAGASGFATVASVAGFSSFTSIAGFATVTSVAGFSTFASTSGFATVSRQASISTSVIGGVANVTTLQVTGVSTFSSGAIIIGTGQTSGVTSTTLQLIGANSSAYIAGNVGIGTTDLTYRLDVSGDINSSGVIRVNGRNILDDAVIFSIALG